MDDHQPKLQEERRLMSLVTLGDKQTTLGLVGRGSPAQDRLLLSLAQRTTWTHNQRTLVERLVRAHSIEPVRTT